MAEEGSVVLLLRAHRQLVPLALQRVVRDRITLGVNLVLLRPIFLERPPLPPAFPPAFPHPLSWFRAHAQLLINHRPFNNLT